MKIYYIIFSSILLTSFSSQAMHEEEKDSQKNEKMVHIKCNDDSDTKAEESLDEARERRKRENLSNLSTIPHRPANSRINSKGETPPTYSRNDKFLNGKIIEFH